MFPIVVEDTLRRIRDLGGSVRRELESGLVVINDEFTISLVISRCEPTKAGAHRWTIRLETGLLPDITVAVRMAPGNRDILDYYRLPAIDMNVARLRLAEDNGIGLDAYRFTSLERLRRDYRSVEDSLGDIMLSLVVTKGYVAKLFRNEAVADYIDRHHGELAAEMQGILEAVGSDARTLGR
jgi:hypothetical protein